MSAIINGEEGVLGEIECQRWRTGVLDERTGIVDRCSEEAGFPLSSLLEEQNYYKYKENNLEKGRRT